MYKRVISVLLCILMISAMTLSLCSCKDKKGDEYPVTIGNITIEKEPQNIVVLSDCMADIISYMGYDVKMVGRSIEADQEFLSVVPLVGTASEPNVDSIISYETDLVIAEDTLSDSTKSALSNAGIPVLTLTKATSFDELNALYVNLGTALGGNVTGREQGQKSHDDLMKTITDFENAIPNDNVKTACYLYLNEADELCTLTKGSIEYDVFSYNCAINVLSSQQTALVDLDQLRISTPSFIFYDNEEVIEHLKNNSELCNMNALTSNKTFLLKFSDFGRQGTTYEEMVYRMIEFMFITSAATPDEATPGEATPEQAQTEEETVVGFVE